MSEWHEQREAVAWFKERWPEHAMSIRVSLNGINLPGGQKAARIISQAKAQGMVTGESDLCLALPKGGYGCLMVEHKAQDDTRGPTEAQLEYVGYHNMIGNRALVTKGVEQLKDAIREYMEL